MGRELLKTGYSYQQYSCLWLRVYSL